ncbi:MAG TPA: hypothetical protein VKY74_26200, partial [Chloroflexia bacterium]|nr:hypothetical protein [Chloroflexia bacterium]
MVGRLLRLKLYLAFNTVWRGSLWRKLRTTLLSILGLGAVVYIYSFSYSTWRLLLITIPADAIYVLPLIFSAIFLFMLTGGIVVGLRQLYIATDLELLLSLPLPLRDIYLLKSAEVALSDAALLTVAAVPLVAYGAAAGLGIGYYLLAGLALLALALLCTWVDLLLVVALVRVLPGNRARNLIVVVSAAGGMIVYLASRLFRPGLAAGARPAQGFTAVAAQLASLGHAVAGTPPGWAGDMLVGWGRGDLGGLAGNSVLLLGSTAALGALGYAMFARAFYQGWAAVQNINTRRTQPRTVTSAPRPGRRAPLARLLPLLEGLFAPFPPPLRALMIKDWRTALRDPNYIMQTVWALLFVGVSFLTPGRAAGGGRAGDFWITLVSLALVPYLLCQVLALPAFGREGSGMAILRGSSLAVRTIFLAKWLQAFLPVTLVTWGLIAGVGLVHPATGAEAGVAFGSGALLAAGLALIGVAAGALAPDYRARRERSLQVAGLLGTLAWLVLSVLYTAATLGLAVVALLGPLDPRFTPLARVLPAG